MDNRKTQILVLVEGEKTDVNLMLHLLNVYGISQNHEIVSYNTNIYELYNHMFRDEDPNTIDFLQLLKEHENDPTKKLIFDRSYSDILLIFDLDPQDPQFSMTKIEEMAAYFVESSDMGKLYLNYPMVEAFYHMRSIPDKDYESYTTSLQELQDKAYKARVQRENRDHDYRKFAANRDECSIVIRQNIEKACHLARYEPTSDDNIPEGQTILDAELTLLSETERVSVLCTCAFYIWDYNPNLLA